MVREKIDSLEAIRIGMITMDLHGTLGLNSREGFMGAILGFEFGMLCAGFHPEIVAQIGRIVVQESNEVLAGAANQGTVQASLKGGNLNMESNTLGLLSVVLGFIDPEQSASLAEALSQKISQLGEYPNGVG